MLRTNFSVCTANYPATIVQSAPLNAHATWADSVCVGFRQTLPRNGRGCTFCIPVSNSSSSLYTSTPFTRPRAALAYRGTTRHSTPQGTALQLRTGGLPRGYLDEQSLPSRENGVLCTLDVATPRKFLSDPAQARSHRTGAIQDAHSRTITDLLEPRRTKVRSH